MKLTSSSRSIALMSMTMFVSVVTSIRVDWNTNKGPIKAPTHTPKTTTTALPSSQSHIEPAPVWEDQPNDIANPHPYSYVQPPPSRFQHNQDILTNSIPNDDDLHGSERYIAESVDRLKGNHKNGFYIDLPTMADYKRQKKWNSLIKTNYKLIKSKKYNVIAFKHKYHNVPYYIFYFVQNSANNSQEQRKHQKQQQLKYHN